MNPANSNSKNLRIALQNVSVPTPIISFLSLRVFNGRKPSVESPQPLNGLRIAYVTETNRSMTGGLGRARDERTFVVDTLDDFVPHSSITSSVFGLQREVVNRRSQYTQFDIEENDSMAQSIPRFVSSTVL